MDDFNRLKVPELKFLLQKYGITTSGYKKEDLVKLLNAVVELNLDYDPDFRQANPSEEVATVLQRLGCDFKDPFSLNGYSSDLSGISDFGLYDVFNYLLFHRAEYDRKKLKAFKSFDDYRLFADGHVIDLQYDRLDDNKPIGVFRAKVKPTQKDKTYLNKQIYDLWFILDKETCDVKAAYCECPGGADGACRHVGAALYSLEDFEKKSVTDGPCIWKRRPTAHDEPVPVKKLCIRSVKYGQVPVTEDEEEFDPRHPDDRHPLSQTEKKQFAHGLAHVLPSASALNLLLDPNDIPKSKEEPNENCLNLSITSKARNFLIAKSSDHPSLSPEQQQTQFIRELNYTCDEVDFIEEATAGQHRNSTWSLMRIGMITASNFKRIASRAKTLMKDPTLDPTKAIDCVMGKGPVLDEDFAPLKWGINKETVARTMYIQVEKKRHKGIKVHIPGLKVFSGKPFLGCSADGIVQCRCMPQHSKRLLEIKCPYALRLKSAKVAAEERGCVKVDGEWRLSEYSEYYPQIQGQLGIYGLEVCDLVVYTACGIQVIHVPFCAKYFSLMVENLDFFYSKFVVPKLLATCDC